MAGLGWGTEREVEELTSPKMAGPNSSLKMGRPDFSFLQLGKYMESGLAVVLCGRYHASNFKQQNFTELLLCTSYCFRSWGYSDT